MTSTYLLGIDLGTTTCRAAIFDLDGHEVVRAAVEMMVSYPRPRWAEVDPESWWQATVEVVRGALAAAGERQITPEQIAGVGMTGLMHAPVLLDGNGRVVAPAMLWMDQRCAPQCEAMQREAEAAGLSGVRPVGTSQTAAKLRWLAQEQPEVLAGATRLLLPKDYVRFRLTSEGGTDPSDAGGTGMFDREAGEWNWSVVDLARVPRRLLPAIHAPESVAGRVTPRAAAQTGLPAGTPVAVGGGDTFCTRLGAGPLAPGEVCIYVGTAAWIAMPRSSAADGRTRVRGFGATSTTGAALRWARDLLSQDEGPFDKLRAGSTKEESSHTAPDSSFVVRRSSAAQDGTPASYDALTRMAAEVEVGAEGLLFLPHLMGERGPEAEPLAQGALVGLTLRHRRGHITRAVLEGTAFQIRRLLEASAGLGSDDPPRGGLACGGGAHSALWMQILADATGLQLRAPEIVEAGVLGAGILAGVAAGTLREPLDLEAAQARMVRPGATYTPRPEAMAQYETIYRRYCALNGLLMPWFRETSGLGLGT